MRAPATAATRKPTLTPTAADEARTGQSHGRIRSHEPPDRPHPHRARAAGDRDLLAGRARRRHRVSLRPGAARPGNHAAGERRHRGADPPRVRQSEGRGGSGRRLARPGGQDECLSHRPRALRQGERDHGELLRQALPGARGGRRRGAAARCAGRDRVRPAPSLSPRPGPEGRPSPAERAEHRPVTSLRGVGAALAERLARLSVRRVSDLLFVLPRLYEDRTQLTAIGSLQGGARAAIEGEIQLTEIAYRGRRQLLTRVSDGSGMLTLRFFHFSASQQEGLARGTRLRCFGEVRLAELAAGRHPAQRRLAFEELLAHHLALKLRKRSLKSDAAWPLPDDPGLARRFLGALPFRLTRAQARALADVHEDLTAGTPMVRLLQGDVGCGKTVVAAAAAARAAGAGAQAALMAPTELLAEQHWRSFRAWFSPLGETVALLSGGTPARTRRSALEAIASGEVRVVIGTHALFQEGIEFARLAEACRAGRQAYWVCPLIDESDELRAQAAEETAARLTEALPGVRVGLVHGRMPGAKKDKAMLAFQAGKIQLLIATTVIEVGVDVPNATLMVIDNAERLGLAQLHQLRGRVGRGTEASSSVLLITMRVAFGTSTPTS